MKKLLNLVLTGMLLTVLSFGTAIVADADTEVPDTGQSDKIDLFSSGYYISITSASDTFYYVGSEIRPEFTVYSSDNSPLDQANYTVSYENNTGIGTGKIIVTGLEEKNYTGELTKDFSIIELKPVANENLVYSGSAQPLVTVPANLPSDISITYSLGDSTDYKADIPSEINQGTYKVNYKVKSNSTSFESSGSFDAVIAPLPVTITVKGKNLSQTFLFDYSTFKGVTPEYSVAESCEFSTNVNSSVFSLDTSKIKYDNKSSFTFGSDVGSYDSGVLDGNKFTISDVNNAANFNISFSVDSSKNKVSLVINKADVVSAAYKTPSGQAFYYTGTYNPSYRPVITVRDKDGSNKELTNDEAIKAGFDYYYGTKPDDLSSHDSSRLYTNASYSKKTVYFKVVNKNFNDATGTWEFTLLPKELTSSDINWSEISSFVYDGQTHVRTATVKKSSLQKIDIDGNKSDYDTCAVKVSGEKTNVGSYKATIESFDNPNYDFNEDEPITSSFTITPRTVTLTWPVNYSSGTNMSPQVGNLVPGDSCTATSTVTSATSTNATTYTVTVKSLSNSNYALPSSGLSKTYTVAKTSTGNNNSNVNTIKSVGSTSTTKSSSTTTGTTNKSSSSTSNSGSSSNKSTSSSTGSVSGSGSSSTGSSSSSLGSSSSSDLLTSNNESALDLGPSTSTLEAGSSSGVSEGTLDEEALADGWLEAEEDDVYYDSHAVDSDMYDAAPDMSYARAAHLASPESTGTILGLVFGIAVCCMIAGIIFVILHFRKAKSQL